MTTRASVVPQLLGAAVGIVLGTALLFAVIGMLRDDGPTPEVVADGATEPVDDGATEPVDEDAPEPTGEPSPVDQASPEPSPEPEPEPTEEPEPEAVDPATVSIQVLDAVGGEEGAAAARAVADELRAAGYDVVTINRAGRQYDVTTVFWSPGQDAAGKQVAAFLEAGRSEETPDEVQLSDSVEVHVVVGADRTNGAQGTQDAQDT